MNKKIVSNKSVLLIATMLSTMMLATSSMASLVPTTAFAQEDRGEVQVGDGGVGVDPIIQTNVQADVKANVDTAVVTDEENCDEASNDVNQEISQPSEQQASRDVEAGDDSLYVGPIIQTSEQVGLNYNVDTDVILVEGCQPADDVNLETSQSSDQNYNRNIDAGEGSTLILPTDQRADQIAESRAINTDVFVEAPLPQ